MERWLEVALDQRPAGPERARTRSDRGAPISRPPGTGSPASPGSAVRASHPRRHRLARRCDCASSPGTAGGTAATRASDGTTNERSERSRSDGRRSRSTSRCAAIPTRPRADDQTQRSSTAPRCSHGSRLMTEIPADPDAHRHDPPEFRGATRCRVAQFPADPDAHRHDPPEFAAIGGCPKNGAGPAWRHWSARVVDGRRGWDGGGRRAVEVSERRR